jgi:hypothetical protein
MNRVGFAEFCMETAHVHSYKCCMRYFCMSRITYMLMVQNFGIVSTKCNGVDFCMGINYIEDRINSIL